MPSSTCLPSTSDSPSGMGYWPVKQAVQRRPAGCSVGAISPCSETEPREPAALYGRDQYQLGDVAERVGVDREADAVDFLAVGDELGAAGEVDRVEARPLDR